MTAPKRDTPWTPGPWQAREVPHNRIVGQELVIDPDVSSHIWSVKRRYRHEDGRLHTVYLADVHRCGKMGDEELAANAHLIAAAPALAEALEQIAGCGYCPNCEKTAEAALRQARGEQP